jgi:pimeloyl-ACP methyl ester carboxylesterase
VLLHGWTATADLNFFRCFAPLGERFRVLAFDHRGHGRGIRSARPVRLADCADDVVSMADAVGLERFVPVGYSMGGAIAQLVGRRHQDRVTGLVLCATAPHFNGLRNERVNFAGLTGLAAVARVTPPPARRWLTARLYLQRKRADWAPWAIAEAERHNWRMLLEAGQALGTFRSDEWLGDLDLPVSVVLTTDDTVVPPTRQRLLPDLLPDVRVFPIAGRHDAAVRTPELLVPAVVHGVNSVIARDVLRRHATRPDDGPALDVVVDEPAAS